MPARVDPVAEFAAACRDGAFPGGQLLIAGKDGQVHMTCAGVRSPTDRRPVDATLHYDLASLTKPLLTASIVAEDLAAGAYGLDTSLAALAPDAPAKLSVRHLLTHSAGYPAHRRFDRSLPASIGYGSPAARRYIQAKALCTPRMAPPGAAAVYSDVGFIALDGLLERFHGASLRTLWSSSAVAAAVCDAPILLPEPGAHPPSGFAPTEEGLAGVVHDENARAMGGVAAHAGMFGTAHGVYRIAELWLRAFRGDPGPNPLHPNAVRALWAPSAVAGSTRTAGWDRPDPDGSGSAPGWPPQSVGHLGFTGTSLWIEPATGLIVVLLTNRVCPGRHNLQIRDARHRIHRAAWAAFGAGA